MIAGRQGIAKIDKVTTDLEEAIKDVNIIIFQVPAYVDEIIFKELTTVLRNGQNIVFWTSYFRSLRMGHLFRETINRKKISLWEVNTQPFGSRVKGPGLTEMDQVVGGLRFSKFPRLDNGSDVMQELKEFYPLEGGEVENALLVSLINPNTYIHPAGSLLNVGRIEYSKGDFYMYREGITPSVGLVIKKLEENILSIMNTLNFSLKLCNQETFWQDIVRAHGMGETIGPQSIRDRYITEDVPYSLVPIAQIGDKLGVNTSMAHALVEIGSAVEGENYWLTGRNLKSLGLDRLTREEFTKVFSRKNK